MILRLLIYPLLALAIAAVALADDTVYRWVDGKGTLHYGDNAHGAARAAPARALPADSSGIADLQMVRNGEATDVYVANRLGGPIELDLSFTAAHNVQSLPSLPLRQVIAANKRVLISRIEASAPGLPSSYAVGLLAMPGDPRAMPDDRTYSLPIDENSDWELGQLFHGGFSHTDEQNLYAVDLIVPVGTPVLAARDGVVMQVMSGFNSAGLNQAQYAERANIIRILHDDGSMAVYAHLQENGALVKVGQRVTVGEQIAFSGNTGYSSGPHLHFCLQVNRGMRLVSVPFRMVGPEGFLPLPGS
ncbi:peptidoglycan DD-metalloendopeptidase family protein [Arenimonas oryziterrae]|uniref:Peptidase M23 domain-containing protein n=1 Tax=Arenimonas oryziterrae DSM 21050 = YC6267 TaxID=1121015 RepID=A0A091AW21_9GAMM|nr:peptidoglycan DD-metalloendopeptidase family protein [Arenimonas oryziterrae]KFN43452.1 hypothetical protein N789_09255 [Arenimonas oryziterrae DSM 21050 = YC6267]